MQFGVVVTWNLSSGQQAEAVWQLAGKHTAQRIPEADIEVDELSVVVGPTSKPMLKDDSITMSHRVYSAPPPPPDSSYFAWRCSSCSCSRAVGPLPVWPSMQPCT